MKRTGIFLLFLLVVSVNLFAQVGGKEIPSQQISFDLQFQIGFMFVWFVLALLFLMLFVFYPRERLNLFFGLFNLSLFLANLNSESFTGEPSVLKTDINEVLSRLIGANILLFIGYALNRARPFFWWFVAFMLCVDFPLHVILHEQYHFFNQLVRAFLTPICGWLAFVAFTTKRRDDWLIGVIATAAVCHSLIRLLFIFAKVDITQYDLFVPPVITISAVCYLALRYARTNTSLAQQLIQVKDLSEENLRREQEKQQLLSTQNEMLDQQVRQRTAEITAQKETLQHTLEELRSAQAQLIQSEKMASLGELTAGIAHEIQNPLNFVNNFSDVNSELLEELKIEAEKGNLGGVKAIASDLVSNEQKINHHGKRADAIVKGMLQHSRTGSGIKEPTDINKLADEYVRLAYHGLRAKDKSLDAKIETDFDTSVEKINVIPQEIGRVLLNLINNAFYAVNEKAKRGVPGYEPTVIVGTRRLQDRIEISVKDNGNGIPGEIKEKVFQPFFTTKPTGQGTGLGLSLAYDIVKAHGGELKVETNEGVGSEFIIQLPN